MLLTCAGRMVREERTFALQPAHHVLPCQAIEADEDIVCGPSHELKTFPQVFFGSNVTDDVKLDGTRTVHHDRLIQKSVDVCVRLFRGLRTFRRTAPSCAEAAEYMRREKTMGSEC